MNRRLSILVSLPSILLLVILASACKPDSKRSLAQPTSVPSSQPSPLVTVISAAPAITGTSALPKPPACQFTGTAAPAPSSSATSYSFSEPQVVFTSTKKGVLEIYGWLPDNNHLIINGYDKSIDRFTIEVLDIQTGGLHRYAERRGDGRVAWLPQQQALAYIDFEYINPTLGTVRRDLWISRGEPKQAERVTSGVNDEALAIDNAGRMTFFTQDQSNQPSGSQLQRLDVAAQVKQAPPFDLAQWELPNYPYSNESVNRQSRRLQSAWRPGAD